jgi:hypothetical protein
MLIGRLGVGANARLGIAGGRHCNDCSDEYEFDRDASISSASSLATLNESPALLVDMSSL